jgi:hypothetical protein
MCVWLLIKKDLLRANVRLNLTAGFHVQCVAFNLGRFKLMANSDKDYLLVVSDSFEDAQQLWRNKTRHLAVEQQEEEYWLATVISSDRKGAQALVLAIKQQIEEMENIYGGVWIYKSEHNRVAPKTTQSESMEDLPSPLAGVWTPES